MKFLHENTAFIDGQNLHLGTVRHPYKPWQIDLERFRIYLEKKYNVTRAYYYLGYLDESKNTLYEEIQTAGFVLIFREHSSLMLGKKKGNVDTDIVFQIMRRVYYRELPGKIVLVSGDGDYKQLVDFLIQEEKFEKILFPDGERASSLYDSITRRYFDDLSKHDVRKKIGKRKGGLR